METEVTVISGDVTKAIRVLEEELSSRIRHGDGEIDALQRIIDALGEADRIVIIQ